MDHRRTSLVASYNVIIMKDAFNLRSPVVGTAATILGSATLTAALAPVQEEIGLLNAGLVFLLLTLVISSYWGWPIGVFAAIITNLTLNFFFIEPLHTLSVEHPENIFGLIVFLLVSVVGGSLLSAARRSGAEALRREAETVALLKLSRAMVGQTEPNVALHSVCSEVIDAFSAPGVSVLGPPSAQWSVRASVGWALASRDVDAEERAMAQRSMTTGSVVRVGRTGLGRGRRVRIIGSSHGKDAGPLRAVAFVPLVIGDSVLGVLRIDGPVGDTPVSAHPDRMLEAFASEAALALERVELASAASHTEALERADELKSALIASISHDLKTPLAGIKAAVSSLLDTGIAWSTEDRAVFLETIDSQTERLDRTISDLLDLSRIESGAVTPIARPIHVLDLLDDARERSAAATLGRRVEARAPDGLYVLSDESLLTHALVNLVENAAKYSTPGRDIRLAARSIGTRVEIAVEDDGPGIAAHDLPHVFERFYRARDRDGRVKGSGLGLAIVKGFVTLCGGDVSAESAETGTTFVLTLPGAA